MRKIILIVLLAAIFSIGGFVQVKAEESFSVKKGRIAIITVGGMQVAIFNNKDSYCGTLYIIEPKTIEIQGTYAIPEQGVVLLIGEEKIDVCCVFSAVGSKNNPTLESRPFVVKK